MNGIDIVTESDLEALAAHEGPDSSAQMHLNALRQGLADGKKMMCVMDGEEIYVLDLRELLRRAA